MVAEEEWGMEEELLMGMCLGMVSEGKGWSLHQFLGPCPVIDWLCQACRDATAAPRGVM